MKIQNIDFHVNLMRAILWQYEEAPNLKTLVAKKQAWFDKENEQFWLNWYRDVFNVDTANEFGLHVWSRILNVKLGIDLVPEEKENWGFGEHNLNYENGNFGRMRSQTSVLTVDQKRFIIKLRHFTLTHRPTVYNINKFFAENFPSLEVFVYDHLDMTMTYFFKTNPSWLGQVLEMDILPRPSTVKYLIVILPDPHFGFGVHHLNYIGRFAKKRVYE